MKHFYFSALLKDALRILLIGVVYKSSGFLRGSKLYFPLLTYWMNLVYFTRVKVMREESSEFAIIPVDVWIYGELAGDTRS